MEQLDDEVELLGNIEPPKRAFACQFEPASRFLHPLIVVLRQHQNEHHTE